MAHLVHVEIMGSNNQFLWAEIEEVEQPEELVREQRGADWVTGI